MKNRKHVDVSPEFEAAGATAKHYGFIPIPPVEIGSPDIKASKRFDEARLMAVHPWREASERFSGYLEEKISLMRHFIEKKWASIAMPLLAYYEGPLKGNPHMRRSEDARTMNLEIIGTSKPIAEAMAIEATLAILKDRYPSDEFMIEINSVGDRDSMARYARELANYSRKEGGKLPPELRAAVRKDPFSIFCLDDKRAEDFLDNAPKSMNHLSEPSRSHFAEVLEYLEALHVPYEINPRLIGSKSYCSETIFEVRGKKEILAIGERYNGVAKRIWGKKDIPALGVAILMHPHFVSRVAGRKKRGKKEAATKFFFIQFGDDAKKKCLSVIEEMRRANIPVHQSLSKDKLSLQLAHAEKMCVPYIIMMGQKEAMEESVMIRSMTTRVQETVELRSLIPHLKRLK